MSDKYSYGMTSTALVLVLLISSSSSHGGVISTSSCSDKKYEDFYHISSGHKTKRLCALRKRQEIMIK